MEEERDNVGGISDSEMDKRFQEALNVAIAIKKAKGIPIAKYDLEKKKPYLEYADGSREYAEET